MIKLFGKDEHLYMLPAPLLSLSGDNEDDLIMVYYAR